MPVFSVSFKGVIEGSEAAGLANLPSVALPKDKYIIWYLSHHLDNGRLPICGDRIHDLPESTILNGDE